MAEKNVLLLVEDNLDDEALILRVLKKNNATYEIIVIHDGLEALDYLFATGTYTCRDLKVMPQVILLDLKLPKVDGFQVLRHLRADERTSLVPVVILTSSDEEKDIAESYRLGANSYICKSVNFTHFTKVIEQLKSYWLDLNQSPPCKWSH